MRNMSDESCKENQNTHFCSIIFFFENCVIYEMWKNTVEPDRPQMAVQYGAWKTKAINIHSEHVILIFFPRKQRLRESTSMLRTTYTACLYIIFLSEVKCFVIRLIILVSQILKISVVYNGGKIETPKKSKAVPLQAWSGPKGSRKLRFPDFMTTAQDGGKVVSLTHQPPLPPGNTPGTHFC